MSRTCWHYQKGECTKGDQCAFIHPTVKCRSFRWTGWCPYGNNCQFWHCPSDARDRTHIQKELCPFFANGQCKYGDKCNFSHDLSRGESGLTLSEHKAAKELAKLQIQKDQVKDPVPTPKPRILSKAQSIHSSGLKSVKSDPSYLRHHGANALGVLNPTAVLQSEVESFLKMFSPNKLMELESYNDNRVFCLKFSSSNPDWIYYVREILLTITLPKLYPLLPLKVTVLGNEVLPTILVQHLNSSISSWIQCKHDSLNGPNKQPTPYLKSFFHWLDRNLERLFTEGLRMYKALVVNQDCSDAFKRDSSPEDHGSSSGSSIASFSIITDHAVRNKTLVSFQEPLPNLDSTCESGSDEEESNSLTESSCPASSSDEEQVDEFESIQSSQETKLANLSNLIEQNQLPNQASPPLPSVTEAAAVTTTPTIAAPTINSKSSSSRLSESNQSGPGVHSVSLQDFKLCGKAGTFLPTHLSAVLRCMRCRLVFDWNFNLHGQSKPEPANQDADDDDKGDPATGSTTDTTSTTATTDTTIASSRTSDDQMELRLRSLPPHSTSCARCKQPLYLIFQALVAHAFENRIGTLHLNGCIADDIPNKNASGILFCTECCNPVKITNLIPGHTMTRRCFNCHSLVGMAYNKFELKLIKEPSQIINSKIQASSLDESGKKISRRRRKAMKKCLYPTVQEGQPLPLNGACRHYDKSYRWLRFPCCGRLEPCILCHNKSATDGHQTEFANRMVCGFCSKEQPFSAKNPCIKCGKKLTATHTTHWEGGRGCRNKLTMSKKDSKKYSDLNKTVSKNKSNK